MNKTLFLIALYFFIQVLLAVLNPFHFYTVSNSAVSVYLLFILSLLVYSLFYKIPQKEHNNFIYRSYIVKFTNFYLLIAIAFFLVHFYIKLSLGMSSQELRDLYYFGQKSGETTIFNYLFVPMSFINGFGFFLFLVFLVSLKNKIEKYNLLLFIKIVFAILLVNSAESGRMSFFVLGICLVVFSLKYKSVFLSLKDSRFFRSMALVSLILLVYLTYTRLDNSSLGEFLYTYFIGPVYLFDYAMNDPSGIVFNSENRFGFSIMSIDWILIGLYNLLSSDYIPSLFTISDGFLTYGYQVSDKTTVNAFFTFFTFFFVDYGFLAPFMIIAYHFLFSVSGRLIRIKNILELDIFLSFYLVYGSILNMLSSPMFLVTFICLFFVNPYRELK